MVRRLGFLSVTVAALVLGGNASAQTLEERRADVEAGEEAGSVEGEPAQPPSDSDRAEVENAEYFFVGGFYRHVFVPGFIQQLFVHGGIDGSNPGVGASFNWRKNDFNVVASVWWNNAEASGYFRALGDPLEDTEFIEAHMGVIFVTAEFLWAFPITDWFAVELGFDLGFGFVYGGITRTEAWESSRGAGDWQPCSGPGQDNPDYCFPEPAPEPCYDNHGEHYGCTEPTWLTAGGDVPFIIPWVSLPHIALRFKPIRQLQIRVDGGYGLYNFFFGGSVSYGF